MKKKWIFFLPFVLLLGFACLQTLYALSAGGVYQKVSLPDGTILLAAGLLLSQGQWWGGALGVLWGLSWLARSGNTLAGGFLIGFYLVCMVLALRRKRREKAA